MISGSNISDLPEKMPASLEKFFSSFYIFTDLDINVSPYDKEAGALVVTVGFSLDDKKDSKNSDNILLTHQYITSLAREILGFNAKFIDSILDKHQKDKIKAVLITQDGDVDGTSRGSDGVNAEGTIFISNIQDLHELKATISHESMHALFHVDLPHGISVAFGPNVLFNHFWFNEGFTDYYASLLNYKNEIITEQEYVDNVNKSLEHYYKRERIMQGIASAPYSKKTRVVEQLLLSGERVGGVFYYAGRLIAMNMDYMIRSKSGEKLNLDNFMQNLIKLHCKSASCKVSREQFYGEFAKLLGPEFEDEERRNGLYSYMDHYIIDFAPISPPDAISGLNKILAYRKVGDALSDFGFDVDKSLLMGNISGVDNSGNAYKAGLRNSMKLIYMRTGDAKIGLKDYEIEIEVENEDGSKQLIKYSAAGEIMLPYYK